MSFVRTIGRELECSICKDLLREPKVVGPCLHTFCKECILQLVECAEDSSNQFCCSICRAECCLPREGVDGLKTNFTLANLVEIFRGKEPTTSDKSEAGANAPHEQNPTVPCSMCSVTGRNLQATCMCDSCKYITMCDICWPQHGTNTATAGHVLVELCARHGKPEDMYCTTCKCCVCLVCVANEHGSLPTGVHNVTDIKPIIEESVKSLGTIVDFAEKTLVDLRTSKETVSMIKGKIQNRQEALKAAVVARSEVLSAPDILKREKLARERVQLVERLKALDLKAAHLDQNDINRQEKTIGLLGMIDSICDEKTLKAQTGIEHFNMVEDELCTAIRMGQRLKSVKRIGSNCNRILIKTAGRLRDMTVRLKEDMDMTSYERELYRMPAYSHSSEELGSLTTFYARKVFGFNFGATSRFDGDIIAVTATKEGVFSALCNKETEQKVFIWTVDVQTVHRVIDKSTSQFIEQLVSMAASPDNKIVLLRKKAPHLVIVSPSLGTIRTLKVRGLKDPDAVAVSFDGFFLVMEGVWPSNMVVINDKGEIINTIPTERAQNRVVCGHYVIFTCDWHRIFLYTWAVPQIITKQSDFDHKILDFNVIDLTLGDSSMFVIGVTRCAELKVFRLKKEKDTPRTTDEVILTDENGVRRGDGIKAKCPIRIDVCGAHMIIGYKDLNDQSRVVYYNSAG